MRFRLRDILLLMLLLAVYLTTATYALRVGDQSESLLDSPLFGSLIMLPVFLVFFPLFMFIGHRWAVRKARPIKLKLEVPLFWTPLFVMLAMTVACGVVTIVIDHPIALAGFIGASMPFLASLPLLAVVSWAHVGTGGIAYANFFQKWSDVEVERGVSGLIESVVITRSPLVLLGGPFKRIFGSGRKASVPIELREEVTELYEAQTNWLNCLRRPTPVPTKIQADGEQ